MKPTALACLLLAAASLFACSGGDTVQLRVVDAPERLPAWRALAEQYEAAHPGRRVTVVADGTIARHLRPSPDLYLVADRYLEALAVSGSVQPLAAFDAGDFHPAAVAAFRRHDAQLCAPVGADSLVVYYNRGLIDALKLEPPKSDWNAIGFVELARHLQHRDADGDGKPDTLGLGLPTDLAMLQAFLAGAGQSLVDDAQQPTQLILDRPEALRALSWVRQLHTRLDVTADEPAHEHQDDESRFLDGHLGLLIASRRFTVRARAVADLDWDVVPLPRLGRPATTLDAQGLCLAAGGAHADAARDFVAYASSAEGQAALARSGLIVPARISVAGSSAFLDPAQRPAAAQTFIDALAHAQPLPRSAAWARIEKIAAPVIEEWFYEAEPPHEGGVDPDAGAGEGGELAMTLGERVNPVLIDGLRGRR